MRICARSLVPGSDADDAHVARRARSARCSRGSVPCSGASAPTGCCPRRGSSCAPARAARCRRWRRWRIDSRVRAGRAAARRRRSRSARRRARSSPARSVCARRRRCRSSCASRCCPSSSAPTTTATMMSRAIGRWPRAQCRAALRAVEQVVADFAHGAAAPGSSGDDMRGAPRRRVSVRRPRRPGPRLPACGTSTTSSPTQAHSAGFERQPFEQLAQHRQLVVLALRDVPDAESRQRRATIVELRPEMTATSMPASRHGADPEAVPHVEHLQRLAARAVVEAAVRHHAIHVEHEQADVGGLGGLAARGSSDHARAEKVVHVERADAACPAHRPPAGR